jgi:hypothetical protein
MKYQKNVTQTATSNTQENPNTIENLNIYQFYTIENSRGKIITSIHCYIP